MAQETIRVGTINAVSPTLAETLRQCKLHAGCPARRVRATTSWGIPRHGSGRLTMLCWSGLVLRNRDDIEPIVRDLWGATIEA